MAFKLFNTPQRGHLMLRRRYSASANLRLQLLQRISSTFLLMRVGFGPLCAQHGALAKRRSHLRAVAIPGVSAPGTVAPSSYSSSPNIFGQPPEKS